MDFTQQVSNTIVRRNMENSIAPYTTHVTNNLYNSLTRNGTSNCAYIAKCMGGEFPTNGQCPGQNGCCCWPNDTQANQ